MKKIFNYTNDKQIWKILISDLNFLLIEERDIHNLTVNFKCMNIDDGKVVWQNNSELDKDFWIGIEAVEGPYFILHKFLKPNLPIHKGIIVVDVQSGKILWQNPELAYYFSTSNFIYATDNNESNPKYFEIDIENGQILRDISQEEIEMMRSNIDYTTKYKDYLFPQYLNEIEDDADIKKYFEKIESPALLELILYDKYLVYNYYEKIVESSYTNNLLIVDTHKNKVVYKDLLNTKSASPVPDSFFLYKDILIYIKNKNSIVGIKLFKNK